MSHIIPIMVLQFDVVREFRENLSDPLGKFECDRQLC
jgi:hypothetical protein